MNKSQYEFLASRRSEHTIKGSMLKDQTPRTLLYGYTSARLTHHVYLDSDGHIYIVVYDTMGRYHTFITETGIEDLNDFVPSKRLYPERCDFEFCELLMNNGIGLPFTTFHEIRPNPEPYYGKQIEELEPIED